MRKTLTLSRLVADQMEHWNHVSAYAASCPCFCYGVEMIELQTSSLYILKMDYALNNWNGICSSSAQFRAHPVGTWCFSIDCVSNLYSLDQYSVTHCTLLRCFSALCLCFISYDSITVDYAQIPQMHELMCKVKTFKLNWNEFHENCPWGRYSPEIRLLSTWDEIELSNRVSQAIWNNETQIL